MKPPKQFFGLCILFFAISAYAKEITVPVEFLGDWVRVKDSCESKIRLRVAPTSVTLVNGIDSEQFGDLDLCYTCEGGAQYNGEVVWLSPEFNSGNSAPFTVRFNANEKKGVAVVEIKMSSIKKRYPVHNKMLRKCSMR
jgi:hypothetical protein